MTDSKITVVATFKTKAGMEDSAKAAIEMLVAPTRAETGCINYDFHQSSDDSSFFMIYENWASKKDLDEHLKMPHLTDFLKEAKDLFREPVDITLWKMISEPTK